METALRSVDLKESHLLRIAYPSTVKKKSMPNHAMPHLAYAKPILTVPYRAIPNLTGPRQPSPIKSCSISLQNRLLQNMEHNYEIDIIPL